MTSPRNTYRERTGATPSRLVRITDDDGDICQLNAAVPGVLFDSITGNPIKVGTEKWLTAVERLGELVGYDDIDPLGEADRPTVRVEDRPAESDELTREHSHAMTREHVERLAPGGDGDTAEYPHPGPVLVNPSYAAEYRKLLRGE